MTDADGGEHDANSNADDNQLEFNSDLFNSLNLNDITIEDIEEVIRKDKSANLARHGAGTGFSAVGGPRPGDRGGGGGGVMEGLGGPGPSRHGGEAYTKILIQPAQKALRFRYECEGRSAGSIPGVNSTPENKTYPTIQVINYVGRAVVVVSCVTKDPPYRPHPHKLVGKEGCKKGICTVTLNNDNMICSFSNLGIQCVKRKDIEEALREREEDRVDPFGTTFAHKNQAGNIDLNSVRLCFQVFVEGDKKGTFTVPLPPIVSDPIYDKKAMCDLVICKLSDCSASVLGQTEIILLCEKIVRDDVQVRFYELKEDQVVWEGFGDFQPSDVHKQVAISLKTPRYRDIDLQHPVDVFIQLRRPSDGSTSDPRAFQFRPVESDHEALENKKRKIARASIGSYLEENTGSGKGNMRHVMNPMMSGDPMRPVISAPRPFRQAHKTRIKMEPPDFGYGTPAAAAVPFQMQAAAHHMHPAEGGTPGHLPMSLVGPYYRPHLIGQAPSPMDTAPATTAPFHPMAGLSPLDMYVANPHPSSSGHMGSSCPPPSHQGLVSAPSPEVITVSSYSSAGSAAPPVCGPADASDVQQQQHHSSGSTHFSLDLGSLDSLPLSEMTLSIIGSHLSDTFLCLNSDSIGNLTGTGLSGSGEFGGGGSNREDGAGVLLRNGPVGAMGGGEDPHPLSREPSMDSFSCIQHVQDQIRQLNQLGAVGGGIGITSSQQANKFN